MPTTNTASSRGARSGLISEPNRSLNSTQCSAFTDDLNLVYLKLGGFDFTLDTAMYNRIEESISAVWTSHQSLRGALPHHSSGPGKRQMVLPGVVHRDAFGTLEALEQLRAMANTPEPYALISSALIQNLGYWVITQLNLTHEQIDLDGLGRHIRFSLTLEYYGDRRD